MNQLTSQQAGGALAFKGTVSEPATVIVGGAPATVTVDNRFEGQADVPEGTGQVDIVATDPSGNVRTSTYEVSQAGAPKSFTYDLNGNMTSDGNRTYEWDAENRLVAVKEGPTTVASFTYNGSGLRSSRTVGGVTTSYVLEGAAVLEGRLSTGEIIKHFHGPGTDNVLAMQDGAGVATYLMRDHLGSIREHTDSGGTVTLRRDYDPWGNVSAGATASRWAYTGREWEPETSLYYYRLRYYAPRLGRFISEDPLGQRAAANVYGYVGQNPIIRLDPLGLDFVLFAPSTNEFRWMLDNGTSLFTVHARSGPWPPKQGPLPQGYYVGTNLRPRTKSGMVCPGKAGWSLDLEPRFDTRDAQYPQGWTDLRIHPDESPDGTAGCIGVVCGLANDAAKMMLDIWFGSGNTELDVYVVAGPLN